MKKHGIIFVLAALICLAYSAAWADAGYWRVSGTIINTDNQGITPRTCPKEGLRLRFKSRWAGGQGCVVGFSGECPWGPSWGEDVTDAQGRFSEASYRFANVSKRRDILIEYRDVMGNTWRQLTIVSNLSGSTPHTVNGSTHHYNLGVINTSRFTCPTVLVPSEDNKKDRKPRIEKAPGHTGPKIITPPKAALPCGTLAPGGGIRRPDFRILAAEVMPRLNQENPPPERISWRLTISNGGTGRYPAQGKCRARVRVRFTLPDMNTTRDYSKNIPALNPGQSTAITGSANLGELSDSSATYYPVTIVADPDNQVAETNEGNNISQGCYNLSAQSYSNSPCP
jgi:hypothetical protein